MELYPDTEEAITEAKHQLNIKSEFPFAPFLTLVGFFLVLSIEQIVWTTKSRHSICCRRRSNNDNNSQTLHHDLLHSKNRNHTSRINSSNNNNNDNNNNNSNDSVTPESSKLYQNNMGYTSSKHVVGNAKRPSKLSNATNSSEITTIDRSPTSSTHSGNDFLLESGNTRSDQVENVKIEPCNNDDDYYDDNHNHHHHSHTHDIKFDAKSFGSVLRIILLLCAMSVHSIFEGLAVGLQPTAQRTLALFTAILLHKVIIAIGIGVNLATNLNESSTPTTSSSSQSRSSYCLEFKEGVKDRMGKFFFLLLGFMLVALYAFLMPE
ncbi:unnamed protein product [Trichobilharzia regenti]|nr:unnamed protein product [Trichobilharzia regenti]